MTWNGLEWVLICVHAFCGAGEHPLSMDKPLRIAGVEADRTEARVFDRITLDIALDASYGNPFRSEEIRVDVEARPESGEPFTVPAFLYQPFDRRLEDTTGVPPNGCSRRANRAGRRAWRFRRPAAMPCALPRATKRAPPNRNPSR